jgi:Helix-turn-helix domain of resolvase
MKATGETAATICQTLGIGRTTLYRYLADCDEDADPRSVVRPGPLTSVPTIRAGRALPVSV